MTRTQLLVASIAAVCCSAVAAGVAPVASASIPLAGAACPLTYTRLVPVSTAAGLKSALASARPGDQIRLADGTYAGNFTIAVAGTSSAPVVLCGSSNAVLDGGTVASGYVLYVKNAPYTQVMGITVTDGQKGVMLDNSPHAYLDGITVHGIGQEGVHFRRASSDASIQDSDIYDTGLTDPAYGEAVYVGSATNNWCTYTNCQPDRSDRVSVTGNTLGPGVPAEEVDAKEGTTGGVVSGNTFDGAAMVDGAAQSWVDVKGNGWLVTANTGRNTIRHGFTDSLAATGWGNDNTFTLNLEYVSASGYGVKVAAGVSGVAVGTSNLVLGAKSGISNIAPTQV